VAAQGGNRRLAREKLLARLPLVKHERDACDVSKRDADVSETAGAKGAGKRQEIGIKIIQGVPSVTFHKNKKDKFERF